MNEATLRGFRMLADMMADGPTDWQWIGRWSSQRHFGITQAKAEEFARRYGGVASKMGSDGK